MIRNPKFCAKNVFSNKKKYVKLNYIRRNWLVVNGEDLQPRVRRFESWRKILGGMLAKLAIISKKKSKGCSQIEHTQNKFKTLNYYFQN